MISPVAQSDALAVAERCNTSLLKKSRDLGPQTGHHACQPQACLHTYSSTRESCSSTVVAGPEHRCMELQKVFDLSLMGIRLTPSLLYPHCTNSGCNHIQHISVVQLMRLQNNGERVAAAVRCPRLVPCSSSSSISRPESTSGLLGGWDLDLDDMHPGGLESVNPANLSSNFSQATLYCRIPVCTQALSSSRETLSHFDFCDERLQT